MFHKLIIICACEQSIYVDLALSFDVNGPSLLIDLVVEMRVELLHLFPLWELERLQYIINSILSSPGQIVFKHGLGVVPHKLPGS
mmetsp:Transcript_26750/g.25775  ORF Transcript_26750/g.25775 Transcript_26750/m.25775 type:complete len:85 (+) Transcript_26750:571-825(+)